MELKGRHLLKLLDFTPEGILYLVDHADELKAKKKQGKHCRYSTCTWTYL